MTSNPAVANDLVVSASRQLGRYTLRYRIAQGGMASVYLGQLTTDGGFQKWVAIKTIHPHIASDPHFVRMFMNEARLAARLEHPNLCTVFDFADSGGLYYLTMEYLHGETLGAINRRAWRNGPMSLELAARIIADAARGLHSAHEVRSDDGSLAGVVHRDVSPQNIFVLYSGVTKVVDFGIARSSDHLGERTATGILKGKLAYMSPEQIQDESLDRRTDVWSLGVVLWELTINERLFKRSSDPATLVAVLRDPIPRPSELRGDFSPDLEAIVMRALEREPSKRFQTAQEFARALEKWLMRRSELTGADEVSAMMQSLFSDRIAFRDKLLHPASTAPEAIQVVDEWADTTGRLPAQTLSSASSGRPSDRGSNRPPVPPKKNERPRPAATSANPRDVFGPPVRPNQSGQSGLVGDLREGEPREPVIELATVKVRAMAGGPNENDIPMPLQTRAGDNAAPMVVPRAPRVPADLVPLPAEPAPFASADSSTPSGRVRVPGSHPALRMSAVPQHLSLQPRRSQRATVVAVVAGVIALLVVLAIVAPWRSRGVHSPRPTPNGPVE